jgi:hypothetical protein
VFALKLRWREGGMDGLRLRIAALRFVRATLGCLSRRDVETLDTFFVWRCGPTRARVSSFIRFPDHTQRRTTVGRTPLDE